MICKKKVFFDDRWLDAAKEATAFASRIGPDRVISISETQFRRSIDGSYGHIVVWYWGDEEETA